MLCLRRSFLYPYNTHLGCHVAGSVIVRKAQFPSAKIRVFAVVIGEMPAIYSDHHGH